MISRTQAQIISAVVVVVFAISIWASGGQLHSSWLRFYSVAVTAIGVLVALWDRLLWRLPFLQSIHGTPRNLRGTWQGTLRSQWINPNTGKSPEAKTVYLAIHQTASSVSVRLLTDESESRSSFGRVIGDGIETSLNYVYLNTPDNSIQDRSRIHHGSTALKVTGQPATRLRGHYWTDRDSRGELDFAVRARGLADDFASAQALFGDG